MFWEGIFRMNYNKLMDECDELRKEVMIYKCEVCKKEITKNIAGYSRGVFKGQELCISCQKNYRLKNYPVKLANYINKHV